MIDGLDRTTESGWKGKPRADTIAALTLIWQRALQRSPIGPDERLSDLCTDDAVTDRVFYDIGKELGREMPSATICYALTITALADILQQPALPVFPPLVQLKGGDDKAAVVIFPGVGGRASFSDLAKQIETDHAIYGFQARGVDGREEPLESVEAMAELYRNALCEVQSRGPYFLLGYSFGGLVALEMARHLAAAHKPVALLALMDTYPDPRYLPWLERLRLAVRRANFALRERLTIRGPKDSAADRPPAPRLSFAATMQRVKESDLRAMARYQPGLYSGRIRFLKSETVSYLPTDPAAVWKGLGADLQVETVPGDHVGMVAEHFRGLAAVLTRHLHEASAQ